MPQANNSQTLCPCMLSNMCMLMQHQGCNFGPWSDWTNTSIATMLNIKT